MFGIDDAILGAGLSIGGKLLSGLGSQQSAKKSNKLAAANNQVNQWLQQNQNDANAALGRGLVARSDELPAVNLAAWQAAGDAAGFNRASWLNAGTLSLFDNRQEKTQLLMSGTQLQSPGMTPYSGGTQGYSAMSAIGGAVSEAGSQLTDYSNAQAKLAERQDYMRQFLSTVAKARASGNPMAGLGTPSFSSAGPLVTGGGAVAALSLGKKEVLDSFDMKHKPAEVFDLGWWGRGQQDPSLPAAVNVDAAYGWPAGPLFGFMLKAPSDAYWNATGRSAWSDFPADWSLAKRDAGYSSSSPSVRNADLVQAWEAAQPGILSRNNPTSSAWWSWPYTSGSGGDWSVERLK